MQEREEVVEERRTSVEQDPLGTTRNVNVAPDGTTNVEENGAGTVIEEEHVVEEHAHREP